MVRTVKKLLLASISTVVVPAGIINIQSFFGRRTVTEFRAFSKYRIQCAIALCVKFETVAAASEANSSYIC